MVAVIAPMTAQQMKGARPAAQSLMAFFWA
jgi:hypothetical protein